MYNSGKKGRVKISLLILLSVLISGCVNPPDIKETAGVSDAATKFEGRYIDIHTHIMPGKVPLPQIIQSMDDEGIDMMVIMESPTDIYSGKPQAEYGIPEAAEKYPDRFIALYGGEAITMLYSAADRGNYTKAEEEKFAALLEEAMKSGKYRGIGEVALLHSPSSRTGDEVAVPGDHPWMLLLSDIAARYDAPIDIHMETTDEAVAGFERLLDHNKSTKFIWEHAGRSNTGNTTPALMRKLMEKHPNLYSAVKLRKAKTPEDIAVRILDEEDKITPEWMALFKDFPERFMVGSDIQVGEKEDEFAHIKKQRKFLRQLPTEMLKKIERENAKKIYKIN